MHWLHLISILAPNSTIALQQVSSPVVTPTYCLFRSQSDVSTHGVTSFRELKPEIYSRDAFSVLGLFLEMWRFKSMIESQGTFEQLVYGNVLPGDWAKCTLHNTYKSHQIHSRDLGFKQLQPDDPSLCIALLAQMHMVLLLPKLRIRGIRGISFLHKWVSFCVKITLYHVVYEHIVKPKDNQVWGLMCILL